MRFGWEGAMPAASLETTLELWSATLRQAKQRIRPLFAAPPVAASANAFRLTSNGGCNCNAKAC